MLRRIDDVPWWSFRSRAICSRASARALALARRARHRAAAAVLPDAACWCAAGSTACRCIIARPARRLAYFRSAKAALRKLHRAGVCHNDLAKEQNWLRGADGRAYLTDFQLASCFSRRGRLFRIAAYEDLRHCSSTSAATRRKR